MYVITPVTTDEDGEQVVAGEPITRETREQVIMAIGTLLDMFDDRYSFVIERLFDEDEIPETAEDFQENGAEPDAA